MVYLTRKEHFNAAHRLYQKNWTPEKNEEVFGICANPNYHGHNYELWVTVKGDPEPETGFIINARTLSKIIQKEVVDRFDHKNLNVDIPEFEEIQPTTENFAKLIWSILEPHLPEKMLYSVRLQETENIYTEYFGD